MLDLSELQSFDPVIVRGEDANFARYAPELNRREVNLVTWRPHMPQNLKAALETVDLDIVASKLKKEKEHHHFWQPFVLGANFSDKRSVKRFNRQLTNACNVFFSNKQHAESLGRYLSKRTQQYGQAIQSPKVGVGVLVMEPCHEYWLLWHGDEGKRRGIQTLIGKFGTLAWPYRPPSDKDDPHYFWDDPRDDLPQISPEEFGVFKCKAADNPLIHTTVSARLESKKRLIAIYSTPNAF